MQAAPSGRGLLMAYNNPRALLRLPWAMCSLGFQPADMPLINCLTNFGILTTLPFRARVVDGL